jgi:hypothetical protein
MAEVNGASPAAMARTSSGSAPAWRTMWLAKAIASPLSGKRKLMLPLPTKTTPICCSATGTLPLKTGMKMPSSKW